MLSVLKIENIAIIESSEIEFFQGFNVLSGETGAGKSIILDSINAVLGFRTSRELIRTGATEARVTALFSCVGENAKNKLKELELPLSPDDTVLVSRIISADRNICRVNNTLTNVSALRALGCELISIHGQQDNRELLDSETHISFVDAMCDCKELFREFSENYKKLNEISYDIKRLSADKSETARKIDILTFQINELENAEIKPGEKEELQNRRNKLLNYEKIQKATSFAYSSLYGDDSYNGAVEMVNDAVKQLSCISDYSDDLSALYTKLNDFYYELSDVADELRNSVSEDFSQAELEEVEGRLDIIHRLSKKYGPSEEEMLEFLENAKSELDLLSFSDEKLEELKIEFEKCREYTMTLAREISLVRRNVAADFAEKVCDELRQLDMPQVQFLVDFKETDLCEKGIDTVEFLISANVGEIPKPITKIASGGELSRIMLALKTVMADRDKIATMIFDEVDTGVSGRAALKVAEKLSDVSKGKQVICVTHLAQLMSYADNHFLIEKSVKNNKTYTSVTPLDLEGRKREIARITGGGDITDTQLDNAEEMLRKAKR